MALALRFAGNYFTANQNAYGLKDSDLAVVIVARHKSTSFAYTDAIWAKYGKQLSEQAEFTDPKTKEPPKINVYAAPGRRLGRKRSNGCADQERRAFRRLPDGQPAHRRKDRPGHRRRDRRHFEGDRSEP
jgi:hypothetical protein